MKQRFLSLTVALGIAAAAVLTLTACREDAIIKSSLTPSIDNIHTFGIGPDFNNGTDTITMVTSTVFEDTIITSARGNGFPIYHALGWATDPFAGKTAASIYMQVVPTATRFTLPTDAVIDDLVLILPYSGFTWGDTTITTTRNVKVYRISESFSKDTTFYNFSSRQTFNELIGTGTIQTGRLNTGSIQDSVKVLGVNRAPHLRISLSNAFKAEFINALPADSSFATFVDVMRGFLIVPDTTGPGSTLPYFRLNSGATDIYSMAGIIAYGHTNGKSDTLIYQFPYDERYAAHFNRITRNRAGTPANTLETTADPSLAVMQNGPGYVIDVRLPYIKSLFKDLQAGAIVNKAELVFTKYPTLADEQFFGPARLYPQGINSSGGRYTIADRYLGNETPFEALDFIDGTPRQVVKGGINVTEYRINIPRELQKAIVQGPDGLHLRIGGTVNFPAAYRLVVGGRGMTDPVYRPSINIIYSKQ